MDIENRFTVDCAMSSSSVLNSRMWQMPERRRLGTGENITRSGLTAHWDMRRRTSSVLPVINGEQLIVLMYVDKLVFSLLLRTPISSGPRNGEQPRVRPLRQWNTAEEAAVLALVVVVALPLLFLLFLPFALNRHRPVGHFDLQVVLGHPRQLGPEHELSLTLHHLHARCPV